MAKIVPFTRADGDTDWHLVADNGEILCGSVQGFTEPNDCLENILKVKKIFEEGVMIDYGEEAIPESEQEQVRPAEETEVPDQQSGEST
jgi:uncharacterized protein YegP (UPF0339 family)